jgi:hypothetical protein
MKLQYAFAAGAALLAIAASPAFALEQIHIPDSTAAQNSGPPDALFDKSMPTTWQKKSDSQKGGQSGFHFSVSGGNQYGEPTSGFGEDAKTPGSEFHQNGVPLQDPYFPH